MFDSLSQRLSGVLDSIRGQGRLTEEQVATASRELRMALLEADVALPVVRDFITRIKERAVGAEVTKSLTPGQQFLKVVQQELTATLGGESAPLNLRAQPPVVILMACFPSSVGQKPGAIADAALAEARKQFMDVLIVDTAGRTTIDAEMMAEIAALHQQLKPAETLFVVDSMTGQDAANTAKAFSEAVALTGVVFAKLVEKLKKNKRFDLDDFRDQMAQMQNMGSMESLLDKLPGGAQMQAQLKSADAEKQVRRTMAILNSMTPQERRFPDLLKASRKRRIAKGSGVEVQQVNQLLRQFESTRDMMKKFAGGGMAKLMRGLGGRMPKGMLPPPR